jgi:putative Holliday junction resolvase
VTGGPDLPAIPRAGRVLAIDWGEVRIGLALSDETQLLASPLDTLTRRPGKRFPMPRFLELVTRHRPAGVVVGLPLSPDGTEGESARQARELAGRVARRTGLPVALWDERLTTTRALGAIREMGGSARGRKKDVDALAATVLLQHWLEARRSEDRKDGRSEGGPG